MFFVDSLNEMLEIGFFRIDLESVSPDF